MSGYHQRLDTSTGIILAKLRRCMKPDKLAALLYIKFAVKYNCLYLRLKKQVGDENAEFGETSLIWTVVMTSFFPSRVYCCSVVQCYLIRL